MCGVLADLSVDFEDIVDEHVGEELYFISYHATTRADSVPDQKSSSSYHVLLGAWLLLHLGSV